MAQLVGEVQITSAHLANCCMLVRLLPVCQTTTVRCYKNALLKHFLRLVEWQSEVSLHFVRIQEDAAMTLRLKEMFCMFKTSKERHRDCKHCRQPSVQRGRLREIWRSRTHVCTNGHYMKCAVDRRSGIQYSLWACVSCVHVNIPRPLGFIPLHSSGLMAQ